MVAWYPAAAVLYATLLVDASLHMAVYPFVLR